VDSATLRQKLHTQPRCHGDVHREEKLGIVLLSEQHKNTSESSSGGSRWMGGAEAPCMVDVDSDDGGWF
jgi:hypothetical protein